jgi:Recombinase
VQRRVRAAMAAQVLIDGKHQGGRAPYGYVVVDAGPHPNPRKAQEGYRLRVLAIDEVAAPVVERIFALYLDGVGLKGIAEILNRDGILCPSAHTPRQNRHRRGDGWQHATVKAILENPRYTGYAIYGRWQKVEELLDPDDVAAGHIVRFRRSAQSKIVRSREPAHPALVSVEVFTRVQLEMRARRGSDMAARASQPRTRVGPKASYLFRGTIRCESCGRKMEGASRKHAMFYRCAARTLVPGSRAALGHPPTVYVREDHLSDGVNEWIAGLFSPANLDRTVALLTGAESDEDPADAAERTFRQRIAAADATMTQLQRALEAGWDPETLTSQYNAAVAEKKAALAGLDALEPAERLSTADINAMVEELGAMKTVLDQADRGDLADLYGALGLEVSYNYKTRVADVSIKPAPRVVSVGVRGGT